MRSIITMQFCEYACKKYEIQVFVERLKNGQEMESAVSRFDHETGCASLVLEKVTPMDQAQYECVAVKPDFGEARTECCLGLMCKK